MIKRRNPKHTVDLAERLIENVEILRQLVAQLPPGPERDKLQRRIRQSNTAARIEEWISSPGLQPPVE